MLITKVYFFLIPLMLSFVKHTHALRAEPMTFLTREFGLRSERVVDGVDGL